MIDKMKILVCFEGRVRIDSTGFYLVNALKKLGHSVDHVYPENIQSVAGGHDLYIKCDDGIYSPWNKNLHPSHYFCIDTHIETDWRLKIAEEGEFDTVSVVHSEGLGLPWKQTVSWIPVGCDPDVHYAGKKEKIYDGCFIGNFHNNLAGPRVEMLDVFFKATPKIFFGQRMFREMSEKYAQSKIVFNRSIHGDCNMRVFEALCSGSCLVTDRVPDLDKLGFIDRGHYFGYSSKEELHDVVTMLLREEGLRERVAQHGREFVLKEHKYTDRMKVLIAQTKEKIPC